ncbi:MAG: hypothetical protein U5K74_10650 [Gemmatimonadaceae bacterium]|nr:hypothetical protein [Gemmatimonadaceae bacterium]
MFEDKLAVDRLSRVWFWKGPAWYQRKIVIPESWRGKRLTLFLERTKNSRVWVDQTFCGQEDTLSAPHLFVLPELAPGEHTLTILIDNAKLPPVGPAHAVDERTQTNWNGIVGKMELRATDPIWLSDVQVYPDATKKEARVRVVIGNVTAAVGEPVDRSVSIRVTDLPDTTTFKTETREVISTNRETVLEFTYAPGNGVPLWDEFQRAMLRLELNLVTKAKGQSASANTRPSPSRCATLSVTGSGWPSTAVTPFCAGRLDCANYLP